MHLIMGVVVFISKPLLSTQLYKTYDKDLLVLKLFNAEKSRSLTSSQLMLWCAQIHADLQTQGSDSGAV